ncbi:hypothetical protein MUP05_01520 [Candidatus Bathyarchaeota archaeon]|jgi:Na+-transporting NADH:ubiquinone oxidoreductase subunit NqrB|nr:hypothetical protein [Candidatus Bathyarchaeota archaeon]
MTEGNHPSSREICKFVAQLSATFLAIMTALGSLFLQAKVPFHTIVEFTAGSLCFLLSLVFSFGGYVTEDRTENHAQLLMIGVFAFFFGLFFSVTQVLGTICGSLLQAEPEVTPLHIVVLGVTGTGGLVFCLYLARKIAKQHKVQ